MSAQQVQRRSPGLVFAVILVFAGCVLLLANLGTMPEDAGWRLLQLWPLVLVAAGVPLIVPHVVRGAAAPAVTALLICAIAVGAFGYVWAGPSRGAATYTTFTSSSPLAGQTQATINLDMAAERVTITAADLGDQLYRARIDYTGSAPRLTSGPGEIRISRPSGVFDWGRPREVVDLTVNRSVAWAINIDGAGTTSRIDLSSGTLRSLRLNGAGTNLTLTVGRPQGAVAVNVSGVGTSLTVNVPATTEYRVTAEGIGAGVSGTTETSGWSSASDRYDVSVNGVGVHATVRAGG